jgi:hypothetical protein
LVLDFESQWSILIEMNIKENWPQEKVVTRLYANSRSAGHGHHGPANLRISLRPGCQAWDPGNPERTFKGPAAILYNLHEGGKISAAVR